jgi:hypothetical protein
MTFDESPGRKAGGDVRWRSESEALSEHIAPRTPWMFEPLVSGEQRTEPDDQALMRGRGCGQNETVPVEGAFLEGRKGGVDFTFTT